MKKLSRQRKWQLKMKSQNRCIFCGKEPFVNKRGKTTIYCLKHKEAMAISYKKWRVRKLIGSTILKGL